MSEKYDLTNCEEPDSCADCPFTKGRECFDMVVQDCPGLMEKHKTNERSDSADTVGFDIKDQVPCVFDLKLTKVPSSVLDQLHIYGAPVHNDLQSLFDALANMFNAIDMIASSRMLVDHLHSTEETRMKEVIFACMTVEDYMEYYKKSSTALFSQFCRFMEVYCNLDVFGMTKALGVSVSVYCAWVSDYMLPTKQEVALFKNLYSELDIDLLEKLVDRQNHDMTLC